MFQKKFSSDVSFVIRKNRSTYTNRLSVKNVISLRVNVVISKSTNDRLTRAPTPTQIFLSMVKQFH